MPATHPKRKPSKNIILLLWRRTEFNRSCCFIHWLCVPLRIFSSTFPLYFKIFICDVHLLDSISTPTLKITLWEKLPRILLDLWNIIILSLYLLSYISVRPAPPSFSITQSRRKLSFSMQTVRYTTFQTTTQVSLLNSHVLWNFPQLWNKILNFIRSFYETVNICAVVRSWNSRTTSKTYNKTSMEQKLFIRPITIKISENYVYNNDDVL